MCRDSGQLVAARRISAWDLWQKDWFVKLGSLMIWGNYLQTDIPQVLYIVSVYITELFGSTMIGSFNDKIGSTSLSCGKLAVFEDDSLTGLISNSIYCAKICLLIQTVVTFRTFRFDEIFNQLKLTLNRIKLLCDNLNVFSFKLQICLLANNLGKGRGVRRFIWIYWIFWPSVTLLSLS